MEKFTGYVREPFIMKQIKWGLFITAIISAGLKRLGSLIGTSRVSYKKSKNLGSSSPFWK